MKDAAASLKWSFGRLQSYETGETSPSVEDLSLAANFYAVDRIWLAFGGDGGGRGQSEVAGLDDAVIVIESGGTVRIPVSVLGSSPPPFRGALLTVAGLGARSGDVAIYRPGAINASGLHVAEVSGQGTQLVLATGGKQPSWLLDFDVMVKRRASLTIVGAVVAMLRSVDSSR